MIPRPRPKQGLSAQAIHNDDDTDVLSQAERGKTGYRHYTPCTRRSHASSSASGGTGRPRGRDLLAGAGRLDTYLAMPARIQQGWPTT